MALFAISIHTELAWVHVALTLTLHWAQQAQEHAAPQPTHSANRGGKLCYIYLCRNVYMSAQGIGSVTFSHAATFVCQQRGWVLLHLVLLQLSFANRGGEFCYIYFYFNFNLPTEGISSVRFTSASSFICQEGVNFVTFTSAVYICQRKSRLHYIYSGWNFHLDFSQKFYAIFLWGVLMCRDG